MSAISITLISDLRVPLPYIDGAYTWSSLCVPKAQYPPSPWFNLKMSPYQYRKSHRGDKTAARSSYLRNWISDTGKAASFIESGPCVWPSTSALLQKLSCFNCKDFGCQANHWLPARWASGFSGDHQQDHQCLWFSSCYNVTHVPCPSLFVFCWE